MIKFLIGIFKEGCEDKRDKWYQNKFTYYHALSKNYQEGVTELGVRDEMIAHIVAASAPMGKSARARSTRRRPLLR